MIVVGTAGWSLPRASAAAFTGDGTHLARYARLLRGVEINSSFYRTHARSTYARWAALTPRNFRFAVKLPREITHEGRLRRSRRPLQRFLDEVAGLGTRLGPLLVQLPPSLQYERRAAHGFFSLLRQLHGGAVVCEPRHETWFSPAAAQLLLTHEVARVAVDPAGCDRAAVPGGWPGTVYYRLHGSPDRYWSVYDETRLGRWAEELLRVPRGSDIWCTFDNTARGGAIENALWMQRRVTRASSPGGAVRRPGRLRSDRRATPGCA